MISEWARNGIPSRCQICPLLDVNIPCPRIAVQNTSQQLTMRKVIGKRSGSRPIHKKPPELSLQSAEDSKGHCGGLGALEKPSWPRSWRSLSVRPCFPGWGLPGYAPWRTQSPSLGCHKGAFSGPPTPLRAQPETQAQPWCGYLPHLLFLLNGAARSNCLTAGGSVLISVLHELSEWLLALWFCFIAPLGHGYSKSWTRPGTQLLWHGLQATGGTQLFLSRPLRCGCREWCHTHGQISHPSCPKQKPQNWSLLFQSHLLRGGWRSYNITSQVSLLSQIFLKWSCCSVTKSKIVKASDNWKDGRLLPGHILLV